MCVSFKAQAQHPSCWSSNKSSFFDPTLLCSAVLLVLYAEELCNPTQTRCVANRNHHHHTMTHGQAATPPPYPSTPIGNAVTGTVDG